MSLLEQTARPAAATAARAAAAQSTTVEAPPDPQEVPAIALVLATGMWMWLTGWVGRLLVPLFGLTLFEGPLSVLELWVQGHAYGLVALTTLAGLFAVSPRVSAGTPVRTVPFLAAALGGMGAWALGQSLWFDPLVALPLSVVLPLAVSHAVEAVMLGSLFASLSRRPLVALALGAGFQLAVLALARIGLSLAV